VRFGNVGKAHRDELAVFAEIYRIPAHI
jgi:hypothetical protein